MAGLYVHIPFCKTRCLYCDFFSTTQLEKRQKYVEAVLQEIRHRKNEAGEPIRTIYIGGGTPSMLNATDIHCILDAIGTQDAQEITMELNPGDADYSYFRAIRDAGVNRLSLGVQSFQDSQLQRLGRRHTGMEAVKAIQMAQEIGFNNLSIDLMYALPQQTWEYWKSDINLALELNVQHISTYGLMYEEGTALTRQLADGTIEAMDEDEENAMYDYLCEQLTKAGFVHYEVSNFARPGFESKHNSNYWNHTPYIGIGAGAHSLVNNVRSWNPNDLNGYIQDITTGTLTREEEVLTAKDLYNERIMLGLRTCHGVPKKSIQGDINTYIQTGLLRETKEGNIVATQKGLHILNRIIEDLMI